MVVILIQVLISVFVALNMGVSGFAVSFAPSYGSRILKRSRAVLLYSLCIFLGGTLIGPRVVDTLAKNILLQQFSLSSGLIILFSAGSMMFLSNRLKIPQSTSFVAVASFVGAGLYYGKVNWQTISQIAIAATIFSILSFIVVFLIKRMVYPPNQKNLKLYQNFHIHRDKFKKIIIFTNMYAAFGIGTNNIANVVAPIVGSSAINPVLALVITAPFFGLGAHLSGKKVIDTVAKDIVPIGEISAVIISVTTATFVIVASLMGLPTPYVQLTTLSVLAISFVKDGARHTLEKIVFKRMASVWIFVPLATIALSFLLHLIFING